MSQGVHEEARAFEADDYRRALIGTPFEGLGRFRTFGESGPMYEVLGLDGDKARIWLFNSDEEVMLPVASLLDDPQAE